MKIFRKSVNYSKNDILPHTERQGDLFKEPYRYRWEIHFGRSCSETWRRGIGLHYHKTYSEKSECHEGEVKVKLCKNMYALVPCQFANALPHINQLFRNKSGKACTFLVELRPASCGFEQSFQISYGLATDGLFKPNGFS